MNSTEIIDSSATASPPQDNRLMSSSALTTIGNHVIETLAEYSRMPSSNADAARASSEKPSTQVNLARNPVEEN